MDQPSAGAATSAPGSAWCHDKSQPETAQSSGASPSEEQIFEDALRAGGSCHPAAAGELAQIQLRTMVGGGSQAHAQQRRGGGVGQQAEPYRLERALSRPRLRSADLSANHKTHLRNTDTQLLLSRPGLREEKGDGARARRPVRNLVTLMAGTGLSANENGHARI